MSATNGLSGGKPAPAAQVLAAMLDTLAWPLFVLRLNGTLIHANFAARRLLRRRRPLRVGASGLVEPVDADACAAFVGACAGVAAGGPPRLLRWPAGEQPGPMATLSMLRADDGAAALLLALAPDGGRQAELRAYAGLHGLSAAETRVMLRLAQGESSSRAARVLGVSAATVRSQAVSLRRKTGHDSVSALLQTLAALPPLAPGGGEM